MQWRPTYSSTPPDLGGGPFTMEPGEEEWDPGGDTFNHPTAISEAAFPASGVTLPLPLKGEKQGGGGVVLEADWLL